MIGKKLAILSVALSLGTSAVCAQDIGFGGSVSLLSDYVSSGESQTGNRPAVQFTGFAFVPQGFYAGVFLSNVNFNRAFGFSNAGFDEWEIGLFAGYEHFFQNGISLDVSVEHYFYDRSGSCCTFINAQALAPVGELFEIGARVSRNITDNVNDIRLLAALYPTDEIGLRAMVGRKADSGMNLDPVTFEPGGAVRYLNAGIDYALTDNLTVSLDFHRSNTQIKQSRLVGGLTFSF